MLIDESVLKDYYKEAKTFEAQREQDLEKWGARGWAWAKWMTGLAGVAIVGMVFLSKIHTFESFLTIINKQTGYVETVRPTTTATAFAAGDEQLQEIVDRSQITNYVIARETYYWELLQDNYDFVMLESSEDVAKEYAAGFGGTNGIDKINGDAIVERTTVNSISFHPDATSVEFTKVKRRRDGTLIAETHWISTLNYHYGPPPKKDADRLRDPLGFVVSAYSKSPVVVTISRGAAK